MAEAAEAGASVLLVTRNFPPLLGGMENVILRLLQALAARGPVALVGPAGASAFATGAVQVAETPVRPLWRFLLASAWKAWRCARRDPPWLVLAGSGLAAPIAWLVARASGARCAVYLHGLDLVVENAVYQTLWLPFIRRCDLAMVNSRHTAGLAEGRGVSAQRIAVLNPGTEVPELDSGAGAAFRARHRLGAQPLLLSVGRLTRRKGLAEFVRQALPAIVARHPQALLLVIGAEATDALHTAAGSEQARIEAAAAETGMDAHLRFLGRCQDQELAAAYQAAQVHVFPVLEQKGDVEGFGMVALEAAAHGLRTVAFAVGGVPDAIEPGRTGLLVASGDYLGLAAATSALLDAPASNDEVAGARAFAAGKDWRRFSAGLLQLLEPLRG